MDFFTWIQERCAKVNELESTGKALLEKGDSEGYVGVMRQKAELLAALAEDANPFLDKASPALRDFAGDSLNSFSRSAKQALSIGSVFYMSALLFPDEHKPGEPHNLEIFVEELEEFK